MACASPSLVEGTPIFKGCSARQKRLAAVEADAQSVGTDGSVRYLLGVIEATRSHVVDVNNAYSTLASGIKNFI